MNIRIALLIIGSLMAGGSSAARADAVKPLDPDQVPIAEVDRFSDKAATIYMRTADDRLPSHLPGPNEPVEPDRSSRKDYPPARASRCAITISTYKTPLRRRSTSCTVRAKISR